MTRRILLPEEYAKLEGTPLGEVWRTLPTAGVTVIVVEDAAGAIVSHWTSFQCLHAENVWVAPEHQKRGVAVRHLLEGMRDVADEAGAVAFVTASASDEVTRLLERLGATRLPGIAYSVPVR